MKPLPEDIIMSTEYLDPTRRSQRFHSDASFPVPKCQPSLDSCIIAPRDLYDCNLTESFDNILMTQPQQRWVAENISPEVSLSSLVWQIYIAIIS